MRKGEENGGVEERDGEWTRGRMLIDEERRERGREGKREGGG